MTDYRIAENYGVAGPGDATTVATTTLSSCSAVVMFNASTQRLGLYHYGALSLTGGDVQAMMIQMVNDMTPTAIVFYTANPGLEMGMALLPRLRKIIALDNAKLRTFLGLIKPATCTLEQRDGQAFPGALVRDGQLVFEASSGFQGPPSGLSNGRTINGNVNWYRAGAKGGEAYVDGITDAASRIIELEYR